MFLKYGLLLISFHCVATRSYFLFQFWVFLLLFIYECFFIKGPSVHFISLRREYNICSNGIKKIFVITGIRKNNVIREWIASTFWRCIHTFLQLIEESAIEWPDRIDPFDCNGRPTSAECEKAGSDGEFHSTVSFTKWGKNIEALSSDLLMI